MNNFMPIHLKTHKMETFLGQGGQTSEEVESLRSSMPIKEIGTVVQIFFHKDNIGLSFKEHVIPMLYKLFKEHKKEEYSLTQPMRPIES